MINFTKEEKDLLMCAFEFENFSCLDCSLERKCPFSDEDNKFNNLDNKLLKELGIIIDFTQEEKDFIMCAFEYKDRTCSNCSLHKKCKCSPPDEGGGFNNFGIKLLKKLGILTIE
jgi:hypothetical protein